MDDVESQLSQMGRHRELQVLGGPAVPIGPAQTQLPHRRWLVAASLLAVAALGTSWLVSRDSTQPTVATSTEPPPPTPAEAVAAMATTPPSCTAVSRFTDLSYGITYDYDPSADALALVGATDSVVRGRIAAVEAAESAQGPVALFTMSVDEALDGDAVRGEPLQFSLDFNQAAITFEEIRAATPIGMDVVVFLHASPLPWRWTPHLEGFWVGCEDFADTAQEMPDWWTGATLDDLVAVAFPPPLATTTTDPPATTTSTTVPAAEEQPIGPPELSEEFEQAALDAIAAMLTALESGDIEAVRSTVSTEVFPQEVEDFVADYGWLTTADTLSIGIHAAAGFSRPDAVITLSGDASGVMRVATFVVADPAKNEGRVEIYRLPWLAPVTPIDGSSVAPGDTAVFDVLPVEGGARAYLGSTELPTEIDDDLLQVRVTIPTDQPPGPMALTLSVSSPEVSVAFSVVYLVSG